MPLTEPDRTVMEIRELLVTTENKDHVVRVLKTRGMDEAEAEDLVRAIFKQNRWENRKSSLAAMLGSGVIVAMLLGVWFSTGRLFYIWLPLSGIACLWATVKFCTDSGSTIETDDD